jgi:hypothetical protein
VNLTVQYMAQAICWIAVLAGAGLAARPLINRIEKGRDER